MCVCVCVCVCSMMGYHASLMSVVSVISYFECKLKFIIDYVSFTKKWLMKFALPTNN